MTRATLQRRRREELRKTRSLLDETNAAIEDLERFYETVKKEWSKSKEQRTVGHIRYFPAVAFNVGPEGFTED